MSTMHRVAAGVLLLVTCSTAFAQKGTSSPNPQWDCTVPESLWELEFLGRDPQDPAIAVDPDGFVYVGCWAFDVARDSFDFYVRSRPPGGRFGPPVNVSKERWIITLTSPRLLLAPNGALLVIWPGAGGTSYRTKVAWSTDHGATFSKAVILAPDLPCLDVGAGFDGLGILHVAMRGFNQKGKDDVYYMYSLQPVAPGGGFPFAGIDPATFSPPTNLTRDKDVQVELVVASTRSGEIYIAFESNPEDGPAASQWISIRRGVVSRYTMTRDQLALEVAAGPTGLVGFFYAQRFDYKYAEPNLFRGRDGQYLLPIITIPAPGPIAGPGGSRSGISISPAEEIALGIINFGTYKKTTVQISYSPDAGDTWVPPLNLSRYETEADGIFGIEPAVAFGPDGLIHVAWLGFFEGAKGRHVLYASAKYE